MASQTLKCQSQGLHCLYQVPCTYVVADYLFSFFVELLTLGPFAYFTLLHHAMTLFLSLGYLVSLGVRAFALTYCLFFCHVLL